jgi:hypothetical protein
MSNTNYIVNGTDLSLIFQPITSTSALQTGYITPTGKDLNLLFQPYTAGFAMANPTNYICNNVNYTNKDLNTIFAKLQTVIPVTNALITQNTTYSNFIMPTGKTNFQFSFCGAGGISFITSTTTYGGAGSGAWIQAVNIPYFLSSSYIASIAITIGNNNNNNGATSVIVTYGNNLSIVLTAGPGSSTTNISGNTGANGGLATISNTTSWSTSNYTSVAGKAGGNYNTSGTSSGKTSSGSGANSTATATNSINPAGPSGSFALGTITVTSQGAGRSPTVAAGYGSGGASTPPSYPATGSANTAAYKNGKQGCCIINLT